ncbi:MAG: hypothetical protein QXW70_00405 [Candidatus Anstonellales archaeon]
MLPRFSPLRANPLIHHKLLLQKKAESFLKEHMFGPTPPSFFVGWHGYPNVNWGPMVSWEKVNDNPKDWWGLPYEKVLENCSMLVRGKRNCEVFSRDRHLLEAQEAIMSTVPVDVEVKFVKKPHFQLEVSTTTPPMGPSAPLKEMRVAQNPKIPKRVDEAIEEGLPAREAINELYDWGFENYYLVKLLSAGILGKKETKKLVPTRWAITAIDDIIGKAMIEKVKLLPQLCEIQVYSTEYLHNHFEILLLPGSWEFEQFEAWAQNTLWNMKKLQEMGFDISVPRKKLESTISMSSSTPTSIAHEYEPYGGRSDYAQSEAGGYYAGRYGVLWGLLHKVKRQARAVVFREIYEDYQIPVGVWEVRENAIHCFDNKPLCFEDIKAALRYLSTKLTVPISDYLKKSMIIPQSRLTDF